MDDEEGKSKGDDEEDQTQNCSDDSLGDGVIPARQERWPEEMLDLASLHDAEGSSQGRDAAELKYQLYPGQADSDWGHDGQTVQLSLQAEGAGREGEDEELKPVLQLEEIVPAQSQGLPGLNQHQQEDGQHWVAAWEWLFGLWTAGKRPDICRGKLNETSPKGLRMKVFIKLS